MRLTESGKGYDKILGDGIGKEINAANKLTVTHVIMTAPSS